VLQAQYCYRNDYVVEKEDLQPGDLVFWSKKMCNCGRWKEIHHAGIYLGDNKVIEASRSKGRVVIRNLWSSSEWKLAFCARPYAQKPEAEPLPASAGESNDKAEEES
jgi:cell wall-associated NlpC family hydrolase